MKWKNLQIPKKVEVDEATQTDRYARFVVQPLERGYGITLGNALRRVLLSSLQGAAVTSVKIDGVLHEFSTIPGVLEDTAEIILNLKQMRFKLHADHKKTAHFKARGKGEIKAGNLVTDADLEVLNPDLHIATLNKEGELNMEVEVGSGTGYVMSDQQGEEDRPIGTLTVDSLFSPILKTVFNVENTRVGQRTDYDKLTIDIWTDGSILPQDALAYGAKILKDHFALFVHFEEEIIPEREVEVDKEKVRLRQLLDKSVEELELSVRSANCLRAAEIKTIGDLVQKNEAEMLKYRNFGRKSLKEISDILSEMGLRFGMDTGDYAGGGGVSTAVAVAEDDGGPGDDEELDDDDLDDEDLDEDEDEDEDDGGEDEDEDDADEVEEEEDEE